MDRRDFVASALPVLAFGAGTATAQEPRGRGRGRGGESVAREKPPQAKDDSEEKILAVLDDLDQNQRPGMWNVPREDGRLLRLLTEFGNARHVVELGTSKGYSGLWFCLALRKTGGNLTTFDISPERLKLARQNFHRAGVEGLVTIIEGDAHENVTRLKGPIDLAFIDADKEGYLDYLKKVQPLVRPGGLIVAHNMARPSPDPRYVEAVTTDKDLDTVFLNMDAAGIGLSLKKR
ncbi:MAG: O-methyltransferase [Planctomycetes bacterium]|nr:O-methyltransferase [Planctomycetota bacterium]